MKCPDNFYVACRNAQIKCRICKAGAKTSGELLYVPLNEYSPLIEEHPCHPKQLNSQRGLAAKKKGARNEQKITNRLNSGLTKLSKKQQKKALSAAARQECQSYNETVIEKIKAKSKPRATPPQPKSVVRKTAGSGAGVDKGDIKVAGGLLRIEAKHRGKLKRWYLTKDEFEKGQKQGIDAYAITSADEQGRDKTLYIMDEETFTRCIKALLNETKVEREEGEKVVWKFYS